MAGLLALLLAASCLAARPAAAAAAPQLTARLALCDDSEAGQRWDLSAHGRG
jgi:hypothetical protein